MKKIIFLLSIIFLASCNSSDDDVPQVEVGSHALDIAALKQIDQANSDNILDWDFSDDNPEHNFWGVTWETIGGEQRVTQLGVEGQGLATLVGGEKLYKLKVLNCSGNQLKTLNVSQNKALEGLECDYNQLETLDVSKNTALTRLKCSNNKLTGLDVSKNTALTDLYCSVNQLTALDVSQNKALVNLNCKNNQLSQEVVNTIGQHLKYCADGSYFNVAPQYKPWTTVVDDNVKAFICPTRKPLAFG